MINVKELRIDNWLSGYDSGYDPRSNDKYFQVDNIIDNKINLWRVEGFSDEYASDVEPIPLTPEILKSAGFKEQWQGRWGNEQVDIIMVNDRFMLLNGEEKTNWQNRYFYLHELQNLYFALTGQELEINLPQPIRV